MTTRGPIERYPRCPRCGFDLRGVTANWRTSCPMEGRCSECGLDFEWTDLYCAWRRHPRWCVEVEASAWSIPLRFVSTLAACAWPWFFWSSLRMVHEIRWRRLALAAGTLLLALYVCFAVTQSAMYRAQWRLYRGPVPTETLAGGLAWVALFPLSGGGPPSELLTPRGSTAIRFWPTVPGPRRLLRLWVDDFGWGNMILLLGVHTLVPLGFVTLPVSRRVAKVRWAHVVRIALYGLLLPVPWLVLSCVDFALEANRIDTIGFVQWLIETAGLVQLPLLVVWWSTATGRYLRMRHAWGVGLVVVVLAMLVLGAALYAGALFPLDLLLWW